MSTPIPEQRTALQRLESPTVAPADYAALSGVGLTNVYAGLHDGSIKSIRHGQRFRIPSAWVRAQLGLD